MCSILPLVSVTTSAWDFFFFVRANWNNLASSANMDESQHSSELLDFTLQMPPVGPHHYKLKQGWTVSHEDSQTKNCTHCQLCGSLLLLPADVVLLTNDCRQIEFHLWRTGGGVWTEPVCRDRCVCVCVCRNVDTLLQSIKVTAVERGSWGRTDPAMWLLGEMGISSVA